MVRFTLKKRNANDELKRDLNNAFYPTVEFCIQFQQGIHAIYNDDVAAIDFMNGNVLEGHLPAKALAMVREWIQLHQTELQEIWKTQEFKKLPPLE